MSGKMVADGPSDNSVPHYALRCGIVDQVEAAELYLAPRSISKNDSSVARARKE